MNSQKDLLDTVLALPETERIELAEALLSSLTEAEAELTDTELKAELEKRWQECQADPNATLAWEEVEQLAAEELKNAGDGTCPR